MIELNASTYFMIGMAAGLLLIAEGMILHNNGGRLSSLVLTITSIEMGWLVLCIYALFQIELPGWTALIPSAYLAYFVVAAWQYGRVGNFDDVESLSDFRIPQPFARVEMMTGAGLLALSALAWVQFAEQLANTA